MRGRKDGSGNTFDLLKVNRVKIVFLNHLVDSFDKLGTVLRAANGIREESGTSPSADGNAGRHVIRMSLCDELMDEVGAPRLIKAEHRCHVGWETKTRTVSLSS